jgi:SET domain-containing protein
MRERVRVGESERHGRGLFARKRFRAGEFIAEFRGRSTSEDGLHVLWLRDDDGGEEGLLVENELRYLNHSGKPNAEIDGLDLLATRNIQPGAEILIHYGDDWNDVD